MDRSSVIRLALGLLEIKQCARHRTSGHGTTTRGCPTTSTLQQQQAATTSRRQFHCHLGYRYSCRVAYLYSGKQTIRERGKRGSLDRAFVCHSTVPPRWIVWNCTVPRTYLAHVCSHDTHPKKKGTQCRTHYHTRLDDLIMRAEPNVMTV